MNCAWVGNDMNSDEIKYSVYQPSKDLLDRLSTFFEKVYGNSKSFKQRSCWEFLQYPSRLQVRIYCAEVGEELVGITVRHAVEVMCHGEIITACFASNSMVHPEYRGKGIIRILYKMAADSGGLQFSKGTALGMYNVLKSFGYKDVIPNTYQVCLVAPVKWVLQKIGVRFPTQAGKDIFLINGYSELVNISENLQGLCDRSKRDGVVKDYQYLRWRYIDIPHKSYRLFLRMINDIPVSLVVLRITGNTVYLVDLLWDSNTEDEPESSVVFAKKFARHAGGSKLVAWATLNAVRNALKKNSFIDRGETPKFSFFSDQLNNAAIEWSSMHFVHGEGDIDYL